MLKKLSTLAGRPNTYRYRKNIKTWPTLEQAQTWAESIDVQLNPKKTKKLSLHTSKPKHVINNLWGDNFVIYSVQNNSPVCEKFKTAVDLYCMRHDAQQIAYPIRYQNLTPFTASEERDVWWTPGLPYVTQPIELTKYLAIYPEICPQATTQNPLNGLKNRTKKSLIVGTNRQHIRSMASNSGEYPSLFLGTGSITEMNWREGSSLANKAQPGFAIGALVVNRIPGTQNFLWRHIEWRDGCFYDLNECWDENGMVTFRPEWNSPTVLMLGDWHAKEVSNAIFNVTKDMVGFLKPDYTILQDCVTFDFGHWMTERDRMRLGTQGVDSEFKLFANQLKEMVRWPTKLVVIDSNHHHHIDSWLKDFSHAKWPSDARFYHRIWLSIIENGYHHDSFWHAMFLVANRADFYSVRWLERNEPCMPGKWAYYHGHAAPSGGKGGPGAFDNFTHRVMHGHTHSVGRGDNWLCVGTNGEIDQSFHSMGSSCMHANGLEYPNGTATHLPVVEDAKGNLIWRISK
jgi:hypothetical protein